MSIIKAAIASDTVTMIIYSSVAMTANHETFPNWGPDYLTLWRGIGKTKLKSGQILDYS